MTPTLTPARQTAIFGALIAAALITPAGGQQAPTPSQTASPAPSQTAPATPPVHHAPEISPLKALTAPERARTAIAALPALPFNNTTVVIDPAHGGSDNGSRINDNIVEKDVTLALAFKLRSLLSARGFNVVLTRDSDAARNASPPFAPLTLDDRAGLANHQRAAACLLLHATSSGLGVHLYSSELEPALGESTPQPWLTGQAAWVPQSQQLTGHMNDALARSQLAVVSGAASVRPLDSLTCPALVIELAPRTDNSSSITDDDYQSRVAQAITGALVFWKDAARPAPHLSPPTPVEAVP